MQYLDQILADYNRNTQVCKHFIRITLRPTLMMSSSCTYLPKIVVKKAFFG